MGGQHEIPRDFYEQEVSIVGFEPIVRLAPEIRATVRLKRELVVPWVHRPAGWCAVPLQSRM